MLRAPKRRIKQTLGPVVRGLRARQGVLAPAHWGLTVTPERHLAFEGVSLPSLREKWGSPLHIVLAERLRRNVSEFLAINAGGRPRAEVYYSYKSNPISGVLRFMHALGIGAEVISEYELWLAFELGVPASRIVYNGPAKSVGSIRDAVARDLLLLNVNHREEIAVVAAAARDLGKRPHVGVRAGTSLGWSGQFGLPIATGEAFAALKEVHESGLLELTALHTHVGGMVRSAEHVRGYVGEVLALADRVKGEIGVELSILDFGGSLATPTVAMTTELDRRLSSAFQANLPAPVPDATLPVREYVRLVVEMVEAHYAAAARPCPRIFFEPGRAMTGNTQVLIASVLWLKAGEPPPGWAILDAGINLAECLRSEFHQIFPATRMGESPDQPYRLAGPICSPGDVLSWSLSLPALAVGDALAIMDAGAYFVPFATSFSFPQPAIVMLDGGKVRLLRRAETFKDLIALDEAG
jgi:diaminopimelate decarboxylase